MTGLEAKLTADRTTRVSMMAASEGRKTNENVRYLRKKRQMFVDESLNQYMHVIIIAGQDDCSEAELKNLFEFNTILKNICNFKTACVQYVDRENQELRSKIGKVLLSCQKGLDLNERDTETLETNSQLEEEGDYRSIGKTAKISNIKKKLMEIMTWFRESTNQASIRGTETTSVNVSFNEALPAFGETWACSSH